MIYSNIIKYFLTYNTVKKNKILLKITTLYSKQDFTFVYFIFFKALVQIGVLYIQIRVAMEPTKSYSRMNLWPLINHSLGRKKR